jgi:hypothetical protein
VALGDTASEKVYNSLYSERGNHRVDAGTVSTAYDKPVLGNPIMRQKAGDTNMSLTLLWGKLPGKIQGQIKELTHATRPVSKLKPVLVSLEDLQQYSASSQHTIAESIIKYTNFYNQQISEEINLRKELNKNSDYKNYVVAVKEEKIKSKLNEVRWEEASRVEKKSGPANEQHKTGDGFMQSGPPDTDNVINE